VLEHPGVDQLRELLARQRLTRDVRDSVRSRARRS
jgi:hypothetical protein